MLGSAILLIRNIGRVIGKIGKQMIPQHLFVFFYSNTTVVEKVRAYYLIFGD